jgi:hypothetical protein
MTQQFNNVPPGTFETGVNPNHGERVVGKAGPSDPAATPLRVMNAPTKASEAIQPPPGDDLNWAAEDKIKAHGCQMPVDDIAARLSRQDPSRLFRQSMGYAPGFFEPNRWNHLLRDDVVTRFAELVHDPFWVGEICAERLSMMNPTWAPDRAARAIAMIALYTAVIGDLSPYAPQPIVGGYTAPAPPQEPEQVFECELCGKTCKSEGGLKRHFNAVHAEKEQE